MICTYVAASTPMGDENSVNKLLESAQEIGLSDEEKAYLANQSDAAVNARENPELVDNGVGSVERFMATFGSPARWAGR